MGFLLDNLDVIVEGFAVTLQLLATAGIIAAVAGTLLACVRVSPVPPLRGVGTAYVNVFRNTPLLLVLLIMAFGLPEVGVSLQIDVGPLQYSNFETYASLGLGLYTAAFVCEALRSGINSVSSGQAEAARAVGMSFGQTLRLVVLPQAARSVVAPMASIYIALAKNTSVALGAGVAEATYEMRKLLNDNATERLVIFIGFALGYIAIVAVISLVANVLERRLVVLR
ncbi:MAG: amino acid ABC transporter permease [Nocardioidaceae bacterium]|nr:amino acid ABC transporter permease [Nocardioidaceae bacterium]